MSPLILRGGLGNQLFQFAAALSIFEREVSIWTQVGQPRTTNGEVDLAFFTLPSNVSIEPGSSNRFIQKLLSWNLVNGLNGENSKVHQALARTSSLLGDVYFSVLNRTWTKLIPGKGVGFFVLKKVNCRMILNGYFQSYIWPQQEHIYEELHNLRIKSPSQSLLGWIKIINVTKPIIIHVRLGDYRNEEGIGVLKPNYFYRALSDPRLKVASKNVWIFTDEPFSININEYVPRGYKARIFDDLSLSPSETLELMRHGSAYVISNSTFSWWAAYLSYTRECPRFTPTPWFKSARSPLHITPPEWNEIDEPF